MELRPSHVAAVLLMLTACAADDSEPSASEPDVGAPDAVVAPFAELEAQGVTRFFGTSTPTAESDIDGVETFAFAPEDGPQCLRGTPFRVAVRDVGSEDLVIFLQGGGACWSEFCLAIQVAPPGIPGLEVLDPDRPTNPVAGWNHVYVPYCDGSLFAGDAQHDDDGDGEPDRIHRGLQNLSAALDVAHARFPAPRRVLLAGSSGGGYGTIPATVLVRAQYPGVPIDVFNDSGVGIAKADDPGFVQRLLDEWDANSFIPASCTDCLANGHLTRVIDWALTRDPDLRVSVFSSYGDSVITTLFLKIGEAGFKPALLEETAWLTERHPERFRRFLIAGKTHTVLLGSVEGVIGELPEGAPDFSAIITLGGMDTTALEGVTIGQWLAAMLDRTAVWTSRVEE